VEQNAERATARWSDGDRCHRLEWGRMAISTKVSIKIPTKIPTKESIKFPVTCSTKAGMGACTPKRVLQCYMTCKH
jgi:hypothetical protein